jgi:membrane protein implicated in regulation of membrane protease activity
MVWPIYNGSSMARGQENPNRLQLIGIVSVVVLFFAVGVIGVVRGDLVLAIVFLSLTVAVVLFMIVVYVSARRRLRQEISEPKRKDFDATLEKAVRRGIITPPIRKPSPRRPKK